ADEPLDFDPGTAWNYSNSGYILLGMIIEKVSGKKYADYLSENIFKPLGMHNSYYGDNSMIIKNRVSGYQQANDGFKNADYLSMTLPYSAGSIMSTVEDLSIWNTAVQENKLVNKTSLAAAFTDHKTLDGNLTNYGYGWQFMNIRGSSTIEHGGGINGFVTQAIYLPAENIFVAVFMNKEGPEANNVATKLAALAAGKPYIYKSIKLSEETIKEYVGVYENENGEQRIINIEDGQLVSNRSGGNKYNLMAFDFDKFYFVGSLSEITFKRNDKKEIIGHDFTGRQSPDGYWKKTDKEVPAPKKEITVDEKILKTYNGTYQLAPGFDLVITTEANKIFAQGTGQDKLELFAETETRFFLKVLDAQVEFNKDSTNTITALTLFQGGQVMEALKTK
ncbi:MAG: serine hydrolase, partial [Fimbriimonadaceae bacterium]|nr:serine hydrolase [Chitinophagales bacterium]